MGIARWDLFCRVIDNHGDIGLCWRLAADLASRGVELRLWIDDASALRWMAPDGVEGVTLHDWPDADTDVTPGEVVIEAFGCHLPDGFVRRMEKMPRAPVWINLEYLSAEPFVERTHRLPSPQFGGPGAGLRKWFFYPGFTARTGGLIREPDLARRQQAFNAEDWLQARGVQPREAEQRVSVFCYEQAGLPALLDRLAQQPTLLLAAHGQAARQVAACLGAGLQRGELRARLLPALTQRDYDHLLWACDLNFVRGEDSFVRAQWAGKPFVWQIYPQSDGAHHSKLEAFLGCFLEEADAALASDVRGLHAGWNSAAPVGLPWPDLLPWRRHCHAWRHALHAQTDLTSQLLGFVAESR